VRDVQSSSEPDFRVALEIVADDRAEEIDVGGSGDAQESPRGRLQAAHRALGVFDLTGDPRAVIRRRSGPRPSGSTCGSCAAAVATSTAPPARDTFLDTDDFGIPSSFAAVVKPPSARRERRPTISLGSWRLLFQAKDGMKRLAATRRGGRSPQWCTRSCAARLEASHGVSWH